jgi:phosphoglycolate phosphatase
VTFIRLVVFDLDGTLVDSARDLASAVNETLVRVAPDRPPLPVEVVKEFVGDGAAVLLARTLHHAGLDLRPEAVLPAFMESYRRHLLDTTTLYPGVLETLDGLGDRTLAVLTNKPAAMSRILLESLGVAARFARVWGPEDAGVKKPDPAGLLRLVRELGFSPSDTALVGDSGVDVATARAAGVFSVAVTYGLNPASLRGSVSDVTLDDIRALPRALRGHGPGSSVLP